jgi:phage/plasmid primase-like uncharacterized protein
MSQSKTTRQFEDIKAQIEGRCSEVLQLLGINPMAMATQIVCPIAEHHAGRPSFRVNPGTNRYFCAHCQPKGASLVDLVIALGHAGTFPEAADYLRSKLSISPKAANMCSMSEIPAAIQRADVVVQASLEDQTSDADEEEIPVFERRLEAMLKAGSTPAVVHHCFQRRIAPLGAVQADDGSLLVPARDHAGVLCGLMRITADGQKSVLSDGRLMGAGATLGRVNDSPVVGFTLDWESQVVLHMSLGGMAVVAYLDPENALLAIDEFVSPRTTQIWVFAGPKDSPELRSEITRYGLVQRLRVRWFSTQESDYSIAFAKTLGAFPGDTQKSH